MFPLRFSYPINKMIIFQVFITSFIGVTNCFPQLLYQFSSQYLYTPTFQPLKWIYQQNNLNYNFLHPQTTCKNDVGEEVPCVGDFIQDGL